MKKTEWRVVVYELTGLELGVAVFKSLENARIAIKELSKNEGCSGYELQKIATFESKKFKRGEK